MRRVSEALTRQRELWSLHLLDRVAPPTPRHSSTPDQYNVYFKYTTWTRPVALLGREGHDIFQPSVVPGDC